MFTTFDHTKNNPSNARWEQGAGIAYIFTPNTLIGMGAVVAGGDSKKLGSSSKNEVTAGPFSFEQRLNVADIYGNATNNATNNATTDGSIPTNDATSEVPTSEVVPGSLGQAAKANTGIEPIGVFANTYTTSSNPDTFACNVYAINNEDATFMLRVTRVDGYRSSHARGGWGDPNHRVTYAAFRFDSPLYAQDILKVGEELIPAGPSVHTSSIPST